jgi:hypothetical protein
MLYPDCASLYCCILVGFVVMLLCLILIVGCCNIIVFNPDIKHNNITTTDNQD